MCVTRLRVDVARRAHMHRGNTIDPELRGVARLVHGLHGLVSRAVPTFTLNMCVCRLPCETTVRDARGRRARQARAGGTHARRDVTPPPPRRGRPATAPQPQPRAAGGRAGPKALVCSNFLRRESSIHTRERRTRCFCNSRFPARHAVADPSCDGGMGAPVRRCPAPRPGESRAQHEQRAASGPVAGCGGCPCVAAPCSGPSRRAGWPKSTRRE